MGPQVQPKCFRHGKHMRNNWELRKQGYLIKFGHTKALFKKKKDIKRSFFPPCKNWPICCSWGLLWSDKVGGCGWITNRSGRLKEILAELTSWLKGSINYVDIFLTSGFVGISFLLSTFSSIWPWYIHFYINLLRENLYRIINTCFKMNQLPLS